MSEAKKKSIVTRYLLQLVGRLLAGHDRIIAASPILGGNFVGGEDGGSRWGERGKIFSSFPFTPPTFANEWPVTEIWSEDFGPAGPKSPEIMVRP